MELAMLGIKKKRKLWIDAYKRARLLSRQSSVHMHACTQTPAHLYTHTHKATEKNETLNKKWNKKCLNDTHNQHSTLSHSYLLKMLMQKKKISTRIYLSEFSCRCYFYCCSACVAVVVALVPIEWEKPCETKTKEKRALAHNLQKAKEMSEWKWIAFQSSCFVLFCAVGLLFLLLLNCKLKTKRKHHWPYESEMWTLN